MTPLEAAARVAFNAWLPGARYDDRRTTEAERNLARERVRDEITAAVNAIPGDERFPGTIELPWGRDIICVSRADLLRALVGSPSVSSSENEK